MRRFIHVVSKESSAHPENFTGNDQFSVEGDFGFKACFESFPDAVFAARAWSAELEQAEPAYRIFIEVKVHFPKPQL